MQITINTDDDSPSLIERVMATKVLLTLAADEDNDHPIVLILTKRKVQ